MKYRSLIAGIAAVGLIAAPMTSAHAAGWHHGGGGWHGNGGWHGGHGGGPGIGLLAGVAAATAALVTLPFAVVGDIAAPPAPVYAAPQPVYAPPPAYGYYPQRVVYGYPYGYPQGYVVVR